MRCLDADCGAGAISARLYDLISPGGKVLGLDIDPASIALTRKHNADRIGLDFEIQDLESFSPNTVSEPFDLIYCRVLLCHLPSPQEQLSRLASLLAPGGLLVVEDIDLRGCYSIPENNAHQKSIDLHEKVMTLIGGNPWIAKDLPGLYQKAGLKISGIDVNAITSTTPPGKHFWLTTIECLKQAMIDESMITPTEYQALYDELEQHFRRSDTLVALPRYLSIAGYRPG